MKLESLTRKDLHRAMGDFERFGHDIGEDGQSALVIKDDHSVIHFLDRVEEFVELVEEDGAPLVDFRSYGRKGRRDTILLAVYRLLPRILEIFDERLFYSLRVDVFFTCIKELGWPSIVSASPADQITADHSLGEYFNALIAAVHKQVNGRDFRERLRKAEFGVEREFTKAKAYLSQLFRHHARLLVIRIDLRYRTDLAQHQGDLLQRFQDDLMVFKRGMRRSRRHSVFKGLVGYVQAMEYGAIIGHHTHLLLLFDGSVRRNDSFVAKQVGEHWRTLTDNDGDWFSSNLHKELRNRPEFAIGMVHRADLDARHMLNNKVVAYLFKRSQLLRFRYSKKSKLFFKGKILA